MKANESTLDRIIRAVLGVILLYLGLAVVRGSWGIVLDVIAVLAIVTAAIGFCPLYGLLRIRTKK